ncbi:MAG: hypothetical protein IKN54_07780 [Lachnospiraceae bacterium]|nr:hypothetical protein [Lachnospiraceae bacterium]
MISLGKIIDRRRRTFRGNTSTGSLFDLRDLIRNKKALTTTVAVFLAIILFLTYTVYTNTVKYDSYTVLEELDISDGEGSQYVAFQNFFIKYGPDGISYLNGKNVVWSQAFEMTNPIVDTCGNYAAIADKGTNTIYIFDKTGLQGKVETSFPIISIEVAKQGVVAALQEESDANYIEVFNKQGSKLVSHKTVMGINGYPLSFSISDDGTKMVVSYVCVTNGSMESKLTFYNFSDVGQNEVDRMVGGFNDFKSTVIPTVKFVTNDIVVAVGDNMLAFYKMKEKPSEIKKVEIKDEFKKVFFNDKYVGLVFNDINNGAINRVVAYNLSGKVVMNQSVDMEFDKISFTKKNIIINDDLNCRIISFKGKERFEGAFNEDITEIIPTGKFREYLMITNNNVRRIKIK